MKTLAAQGIFWQPFKEIRPLTFQYLFVRAFWRVLVCYYEAQMFKLEDEYLEENKCDR